MEIGNGTFIAGACVATAGILTKAYLWRKDQDRTKAVPVNKTTIDNEFYNDANWWDTKNDPLKALHAMTPLRVQYFHEVFSKNLPSNKPLKILDIGCGGGMISEAMTKLGYQMTGVDVSANTIKQASEHAAQQNLSIRYLQGEAYKLPSELYDHEFDGIIMADVLEHIHDLPRAIAEISHVLKPNGVFVFDTINRTTISWITSIVLAQDLKLGLVPDHAHDWSLFITPKELEIVLKREGLNVAELKGFGMNFDGKTLWSVIKNFVTRKVEFAPSMFVFSSSKEIQYIGYAIKQ